MGARSALLAARRGERDRSGREIGIGSGGPLGHAVPEPPLDQMPDTGRLLPLVKGQHALLDLLVRDGEAMMAAHVLDPVGAVIALEPDLGYGQILHERPALRAIAAPYAA